MKLSKLLGIETNRSSSDEVAEQTSALLRTGGDPRFLIALSALHTSWEEHALERAQKLAHDRGLQDGTITELFPLQPEPDSNILEHSPDIRVTRMRHVKIILPHMVKVELFDQDSDIV